MIIMKFGGTSTQDAAAMANVVRIVKSRLGERPFVVISAIAQATNMLEKTGHLAAEGNRGEARTVLLKLFDRHYKIIDELIKDKNRHRELRGIISSSLNELEELIKGVAILRELTPRAMDAFCTYGEILSSRIVTSALEESGVKSAWLDTKEFMITDDNFTRAAPAMDLIGKSLTALTEPILRHEKVPVTQGFIGVTQSGCRTTMGRESSDYSASIIGSVLNASDIQIWTDVDGVLTADPAVVAAPRKIKVLSFEEAYELSYFGAKVLHPGTMLPALKKNIPIHIYNSRRPELSGTLVTKAADPGGTLVKSIAYKRNAVVLNVIPRKRFSPYLLWEHVYSVLTKHDIVALMTATSEHSCSVVIEANVHLASLVQEIAEMGAVTVFEGKGIVSIVGSNIRNASGLLDRIFRPISDLGITMISFGASNSSLNLVLDDAVLPQAVRSIHAEFFESNFDNANFETLEHYGKPQVK